MIPGMNIVLGTQSCYLRSRIAAAHIRKLAGTSKNIGEMFKSVMRIVPQPVVVVTTATARPGVSNAALKRGVTCSSFTSISINPAVVSFTLKVPSRMHTLLTETGQFAVHVLAQNQVGFALHFSKPALDEQDQFENVPHEISSKGMPILRGACAVLECIKYKTTNIGDHAVWYGEVLRSLNNNVNTDPLLYYSRGFHSIGDESFVQAFETQTLPFEDWTHEAHIRMAWYYITTLGKDAAIPVIKEGILKFNEQNKEKISRGYHETVTMFYINIIANAVQSSNLEDVTSFERFLEHNAYIADTNLLFQYYSEKALGKLEAKDYYIPPDKKPLPVS